MTHGPAVDDPTVPTPAPRHRRALAAVLVALLGLTSALALAPSPAGAAPGSATGSHGQTLTVSDVDDLDPDGTVVTVEGEGFDIAGFSTANDGLYLSVCVDNGAGQAPGPCVGGGQQTGEDESARWITNNGIGDAETVPLGADGSFTTTLRIAATDGSVRCLDRTDGKECKVFTRWDHRASGDRRQDVRVEIDLGTSCFVEAALTDFLGITPGPTRIDADRETILNGLPRASYLRRLSTSNEWLTSLINRLYQDTLDRNGGSGEITYWTDQIRVKKRTVAWVAAQFYASREYFDDLGSTDAWIRDLFAKVLLRQNPAPQEDVDWWVARVASKGRGAVALEIYQSPESRGTRVEALYDQLLQRAPSTEDRDYWAGVVKTKGDLELAVSLASSAEYHRTARLRFAH